MRKRQHYLPPGSGSIIFKAPGIRAGKMEDSDSR